LEADFDFEEQDILMRWPGFDENENDEPLKTLGQYMMT
jgi:hypothetical protein